MNKVRATILTLLATIGWLFVASATAQDDAVRAQVDAATANAIADLRTDISAVKISPKLSVGQFLDQTDSVELLNQTIQRSQQIGGPRWIDDQTCQVKLEISGARVAYTLVSIATAHPKLSPIPAAVLEQQLNDWKDRTFSATGTSISAAKLQVLRPSDVGDAWTTVSDDSRRHAVDAARQDAIQHVLDNIRPIEFQSGQTVGDILASEKSHQAVNNWLQSRPITDVRFKDNLQVELTVSTPPDDLLDVVINSAPLANSTTLPADEKNLDRLRREFARRVSIAIGRASVIEIKSSTTEPTAIQLPAQPPTWLGQLIEAEAVAQPMPSKLRTKNAAEARAGRTLHESIDALLLTRQTSIGEAAKQDPRIADAVNRSLLRARVFKVEYRADGSVMVRMVIDSRDLWYELCQIQDQ